MTLVEIHLGENAVGDEWSVLGRIQTIIDAADAR